MPNNDNFINDIDNIVSNIESSTNIEVPEGCNITFIPQEEYEAKLQNKKNQSDALIEKNKKANTMREYLQDNEFGRYFHMIYKYNQPMFEKLRETVPQSKVKITMVRFTTLVAYMSLHGKVKKSILIEVWDTTNRGSINETYKFLLESGFIQETDDEFIMINENIAREKIKDYIKELHKEDKSYTYTRVFCESILNLYNEMESRKRQQLSNLYAILPYINFKYNRLCSNPTETDNTKVEPLGWSDLCDICGYDKSHASRLRKDLMNLRIHGEKVIGQFYDEDGGIIIINPRVYYAGDNVNELKAIMDLFSAKKN